MTRALSNCSFSGEDHSWHVSCERAHADDAAQLLSTVARYMLLIVFCVPVCFLLLCVSVYCSGELDAGGNTPLASALAQCAASGEAIVPEVQQLLVAAEEKVRARNAR